MRNVLRGLRWAFFGVIALILLYVLPQHDVVRISGTEVIRQDFSSINRLFYAQADSGANELATRDVRFIQTVKRKTFLLGFIPRDAEGVMVYRNEDSGWIWPPYFKFDSSDLQGEAAELVSTKANPQWAVITHYGFRNRFFSIYPNAIGIKPVDGPDYYPIPWFNIFFFIFLGIALLFVRAMWRQFRERSLDPALDAAEDRWDRVEAAANERKSRFGRWWDSWKKKPRR
ncbi:DUF1523 family protein [Vannielia sp.]|uniref:DUF1523 family protein n=1 Tax=Vannielia sp. TaxID=2813045 RepID=UPI002618B4EC|nr:DUF1523 family protein [Vannielia sp.]MDF1873715.1 DUF1523 family protein [Vannielia sp.]